MKRLMSLFILIAIVFSCKEEKKDLIVEDNKLVSHIVKDINLSSGTMQRIDSFPSQFVKARTVDIWLPDSYSKDKKYAVMYMHDGQMLFDPSKTWNKQEWKVDEIVSTLLHEDKIKDIIVIAIWNIPELRFTDYYPKKSFNFLSEKVKDSLFKDAKKRGNTTSINDFQADNYLKFIVKEVKPYIDSTFSTHTNFENTFISGSSMGGLISMYAVFEYPDVFGGAACISTHWPGITPSKNNPVPASIFKYMKENLPSEETHKFYFDYGTETLDQHYPQYLKDVDTIFFSYGYNEKNYMNLEFEGADHSEESWNRRFDIPLIFLLKKD